jgi:hypothetical protein
MAKKINFEQLLEYVVNGETAKADELFHQLVVLKSREIYENIIESELEDVDIDEASEEDDEEEMDEATESDDEEMDESTEDEDMDESTEEEEMDENFGMEAFGGDETDDLANDIGDEGDSDDDGMDMDSDDDMGGEEGSEGDRISDLEDQLADLRAAFDQLMGDEANEPEHHDGMDDPDFGGMDDGGSDMDDDEDEGMMPGAFEEEIESIDLSPAEQMREYVEKIGSWEKEPTSKEGDEVAKGGKYTTNTKSVVAGKNDMGGSAKNIVNGGTQSSPVEQNKGNLKGNGVLNGKPKDMNTGNVNKVGGTNVKQFYKANTKGHGAEKKGEAEGKLWGNGGSAGSINTKSPLNKGK